MLKIKEIVKGLQIFERNRVPLEIKMLGIAIYTQTSSVRRTARTFSDLHPISKTSVWNWIKKFEEELLAVERKPSLVAIDEVVKARKKRCVYSAVDVERNVNSYERHNKEL